MVQSKSLPRSLRVSSDGATCRRLHSNWQFLGINRGSLLAALYLLGVLNGFAESVLHGLPIGVLVISVSAIAVLLALPGHSTPPRRADIAVAILFCVVVLLPNSRASWAAVGALGVYDLATSRSETERVAPASIFVALAMSQFVGRIAMDLFTIPLTNLDAALTTLALGLFSKTAVVEGSIVFGGDGHSIVLLPGCASLENIGTALLAWVTLRRLISPQWRRHDLPRILTVIIVIFSINILRLVGMAASEKYYLFLHAGIGAIAFQVSLMLVVIAAAMIGAKAPSEVGQKRT